VSARHALQYRAQPLDLHGLHEIIGRACPQRIDGALDSGVARDHDDFGRLALLQVVHELDAVAVGKLQVSQQHVGTHLGQLNARSSQRARFGDREAFAFDEFRQPFELLRIVVYEQDVWHQASLFFGTY
jgi:hypothetical protein